MARRLKTQARTAARRRQAWPALDFAAPRPADQLTTDQALALVACARLTDRRLVLAPVAVGVL